MPAHLRGLSKALNWPSAATLSVGRFFRGRRKTIRDIGSLAAAEIGLRPIQVVQGLVVARFLGPTAFGLLKTVDLIRMLNKFGSLGFNAAVVRDASAALGRKDFQTANAIRSVGYSSEFTLSVGLLLAGLGVTFFAGSTVVAWAIVLAATSLFIAKLLRIAHTEITLQKEFVLLGKMLFLEGLLASLLAIVFSPFFGVHGVLMAPILGGLVALTVMKRSLSGFRNLGFTFSGIRDLLRVSLPLTAGTLSFGLFRYSERLLVLRFLGMTALGYYGFADMVMHQLAGLFLLPIRVRKVDIFELTGRGQTRVARRLATSEALLLTAISVAVVPVGWIGIDLLVPMVLPNWVDGVGVAKLLLLAVPLKTLTTYAAVVIIAPGIDRLKLPPVLHLVSTATLVTGTVLVATFATLDLTTFIVIDLVAYLVHHGSLFIAYLVITRDKVASA